MTSNIWGKLYFYATYRVKILTCLNSTVFIIPTCQILEMFNVQKYCFLIFKSHWNSMLLCNLHLHAKRTNADHPLERFDLAQNNSISLHHEGEHLYQFSPRLTSIVAGARYLHMEWPLNEDGNNLWENMLEIMETDTWFFTISSSIDYHSNNVLFYLSSMLCYD